MCYLSSLVLNPLVAGKRERSCITPSHHIVCSATAHEHLGCGWICVLSSVSGIYLTTNHLLPRIPWFLFPVTWHRENNYQSLQRTYLSITGCHHSFLGKAEVFNIQILIRLSFSKSKWMLENEIPIFSVYVMEIFCELKLDHNRQNSKHVAECI